MEVPEFPITLPKLCISAILQTPANHPFDTITWLVLKDDDVLIEGELRDLPPPTTSDPHRLQRVDAQFVLSPMVLDGPCTLRVRARANGEETRGLALSVKSNSGVQNAEPLTQVES